MTDELVQLYDDQGRPAGSALRSVMRRDNLRHGATGIVVRNSAGQVFVHRRTDTKDLYPGYWDLAAGGVLQVGEDPTESARRELAEELGIETDLEPLGEADFADDRTSCHSHLYLARWDGDVRLQPEEVAEGAWLTPAEVLDLIADPTRPVMPDSIAMLEGFVRSWA